MGEQGAQHADKVTAGQERYEELQHVFAAHGYTKAVVVDAGDALDGVYKIERWTAAGRPTVLVTIGDDHLIEIWGSPELWGDGLAAGGGNVVGYLDDLLTARRPA